MQSRDIIKARRHCAADTSQCQKAPSQCPGRRRAYIHIWQFLVFAFISLFWITILLHLRHSCNFFLLLLSFVCIYLYSSFSHSWIRRNVYFELCASNSKKKAWVSKTNSRMRNILRWRRTICFWEYCVYKGKYGVCVCINKDKSNINFHCAPAAISNKTNVYINNSSNGGN